MGATPLHRFPYPEPTDLLLDGANVIKALAETLEYTFQVYNAFPLLRFADAVQASTTVTFPDGAFISQPAIVCTPVLQPLNMTALANTTSMTVTGRNPAGTNLTGDFYISAFALLIPSPRVRALQSAMPQPDPGAPEWQNATCHTGGCYNTGIPIPIYNPDSYEVQCGVCGQVIDDITQTTQ